MCISLFVLVYQHEYQGVRLIAMSVHAYARVLVKWKYLETFLTVGGIFLGKKKETNQTKTQQPTNPTDLFQ